MAALGLMKTVLGKKGRRVYRESHPLGASAPTETDRPKKETAKSEFEKEIHCTLEKKSWRRKEIQTERKWAFASIKASTKPKWMNLMMMMMVIKDNDYDNFFYLLYRQLQRIQEEGEARLEGFFEPSEGKNLVIIVVIVIVVMFVIFMTSVIICDHTIWLLLVL